MHIALKRMRYRQSAGPHLFSDCTPPHVLLQSRCFLLATENLFCFPLCKLFRPIYHFCCLLLLKSTPALVLLRYLTIQILHFHFLVSERNKFSRLQFLTCTAEDSSQQSHTNTVQHFCVLACILLTVLI